MPKPFRKDSTTLRKGLQPRSGNGMPRGLTTSCLVRSLLHTGITCLLPLAASSLGHAAEAARPVVGEAYVLNQIADANPLSGPDQTLQTNSGMGSQGLTGVLDPASQLWAGAQALSLRLERASVLLATGVIASAGDAKAAAASRTDGRIQVFGAGNCTSLAMPGGHPAYALALAKDGAVLAAWAQGVNRLVFFDLNATGCPSSSTETALRGQISLSLSASGAFLAAQDEGGQVWIGPRGGEMRTVTTMNAAPAAIGFSSGEGVLLVLDAQGRGGAWNPRNGKLLHGLEIPGGPFVRGDFQGTQARLWTRDGRLVRWDVLHNRAVESAKSPGEALTQRQEGWLEYRAADLYFTRPGLSWRPAPLYEPQLPLLSHSRQADCLRLLDVDGVVRYFHARTGRTHSQCFADDWTPVAIKPDGTAQIHGLQLRIFDRMKSGSGGSEVNVRALSKEHVVLWTTQAPELDLTISGTPEAANSTLRKIAESQAGTTMTPISVPLRQGIAASAPYEALALQ